MGNGFLNNIAEIRNALGLTPELFGQLLGASSRSVIRWEKANTSPERQEQRVLLDKLQEVIKFGLRVYTPEGLHEFLFTRLPEFNEKHPFK
jgi:transcriptional regulator with XRE-family HTH domain